MTGNQTADRLAISELAAKYGHYADHQDWDGLVDLFTADAIFDAGEVYGRTMTGSAEILAFFEQAPSAVAHHPTSVFTEFDGSYAADVHMKMIVLFRREVFSVDYEWRVKRSDGRWLIDRQRITIIGKAALGVRPET